MIPIKVSVIIPVYNAEATIAKCLDSFLAQTLVGWELVLVDDGSTDRSGAMCDKYANIKSENGIVRVIHRANGGVSAARQTGLETASGEYIIHADPDDWVEPMMLQDLYAEAKTEDADMVICDFICEVEDRSIYRRQEPTSLNHEDVLNDLFGTRVHGSCCNKLVKRECIARCGAQFPVGINYCEDVSFNVQLLKHDIKITYLTKAYYHYVQSATSITNSYTHKTLENQKRFVSFLETQLPSDSTPVIKSKLLTKKLAFRNSIVSNKELLELYPEIKETDDNSLLLRWMYNSAFKGRSVIADLFVFFYSFLSKQ